MLTAYFGTDTQSVRKKAFDFLHTLSGDEVEVSRITADTYQKGVIIDMAESVSLFGTGQVVVLDMLREHEFAFEEILQIIPTLAESPTHFILIEGKLGAPEKKKVSASASTVHEIESVGKTEFNIFALSDALLNRDKKTLWILLMQALRAGKTNEELVGMLFWQIKILRLVEKTSSAEEAGQKPYVYQKAKRALGLFKKGELDALSRSLLILYHDGHLGKCDMSLQLERWVLGL